MGRSEPNRASNGRRRASARSAAGVLAAITLCTVSAAHAAGFVYTEFANEDKGVLQGASDAVFGDNTSDGGMTHGFLFSHMHDIGANRQLSLGFEQHLFSPSGQNKRNRSATVGDRPFAGYLGAGVGYTRRDGRWLQRAELKLGVVGPDAQGREVQNAAHEDVVAAGTHEAWNDQVANRRGAIVGYRVARRWLTDCRPICLEATPHGVVTRGNLLAYEGLGLSLRAGNRLDRDFGPPVFSMLSRGGHTTNHRGFSWSVGAGIEQRLVRRNYLLQGPTIESGATSVAMLRGLTERQFGADVAWKSTTLSLTFVRRGAEFPGERPQDFMRLGLAVRH